MTEPLAIQAEGLTKHYGETRALDGLDLRAERGTVVGLLGPNGAGKTTAVRILATLTAFDGGWARVAGYDVTTQADAVRRHIGLTGQNASVDESLTGFQNLVMIGQLSRQSKTQARQRADELLERFTLTDAARRAVKTYSGGMRRRLDLAASLVAKPPIIFLDEPTTGVDPSGRLTMWEVIRDLLDGGTTVLLTTQYLEEADHIAHRIVVIDNGRAISEGTPRELKAQVGGERLHITLTRGSDIQIAASLIDKWAIGPLLIDGRHLTVPVASGAPGLVTTIIQEFAEGGVVVDEFNVHRPSLDDVFLELTGHRAEADDDQAEEARAHTQEAGVA